jgi:hypothetical protein
VRRGRDCSGDEQVASFYGAARNAGAYGVNLRWQGADSLIIEYLQSRSARQLKDSVRLDDQTVKVTLRSGVEDRDAPPGGMLYNLQGRPNDPLRERTPSPIGR